VPAAVRYRIKSGSVRAITELGSNRRCDGLREVLHAIQLGTFHHHARQGLGSGKAHYYAAGIAEFSLHTADLFLHAGHFA
jgi:hypothetical protein